MDLSEVQTDRRKAEDRADQLGQLILVVLLLVTLWHFA